MSPPEELLTKPLWARVQDGDPMTAWEHIHYALSQLYRAALRFQRSCRITPALRERCVGYVIAAGERGDVAWSAEKLANYIAQGRDQ